MISDWLERRRLVRKGLACDKTRLSHSDDNMQSRLDSSWPFRLIILGFFLVLLHVGLAWANRVLPAAELKFWRGERAQAGKMPGKGWPRAKRFRD